jgi:peptide/nickel transport system ATP-binding protein
MLDLQQEYNMAILLITHDLGVVAEIADDVAVMYLGNVVEYSDVDTIFNNQPAIPIPRRCCARFLRLPRRARTWK